VVGNATARRPAVSRSTNADHYSGIQSVHICKTLRNVPKNESIKVRVSQNSGDPEDLSSGEHETYLTIDKVG
jgi:hypothetical protein